MELESCQNLTHTHNVFYSRPTIHKQTHCGLQIQNIIHKLMHFVLKIRNVPIKQTHHASKILQVLKTVRKNEKNLSRHFWHYFSVMLIHTQMSSDPHTNASKLSNKCPVIRTPQKHLVLLRQFKVGRRFFFFIQIFIFYFSILFKAETGFTIDIYT